MKKAIRRLVCCAFLSIASIGCFDADARVTREVAEAVLPYLMEAAGIPREQKTAEHQNAIIRMIYTDEGQQQMVNWAVNNERPIKLVDFGGLFGNNENWEERSSNKGPADTEKPFQVLFPCKTGTFTSFANHSSRFAHAVLTKYESVKDQLPQWIIDGKKPTNKKNDIIAVGNDALDCKIARIIFILDILDDVQQIRDVCSIIPVEYEAPSSKSEYTCRPVSAIIANKEGDCVETLYRHLINIAIQDTKQPNLFHTERLPACIRRYFGDQTPKAIKEKSFSGSTSITDHNKWRNALQSVADFKTYFNTSSGAVYNIARTLRQIALFDKTTQSESFVGSENFATIIAEAMNMLAHSSQRFSVAIEDSENEKGWITQKITIHDTSLTRTIVIGICDDISNDNFGHAEIISIGETV